MDAASPHNLRESASQVLQSLTIGNPRDQISFARLLDELGERSFGLLLIVLALPNCLPFPGVPGTSFVTGMAIFYLAIQLILARDEPRFPAWLNRKSFSRQQLSQFIAKTNPLLRWLEKPIRPRLTRVVAGHGERVIGGVAL